MKVRVLRPFFLAGKVLEVGAVVDIADRALLGGLRYGGKVELAEPDTTTGAMTTETAGGLAPGRRKKAEEASE